MRPSIGSPLHQSFDAVMADLSVFEGLQDTSGQRCTTRLSSALTPHSSRFATVRSFSHKICIEIAFILFYGFTQYCIEFTDIHFDSVVSAYSVLYSLLCWRSSLLLYANCFWSQLLTLIQRVVECKHKIHKQSINQMFYQNNIRKIIILVYILDSG